MSSGIKKTFFFSSSIELTPSSSDEDVFAFESSSNPAIILGEPKIR